MPTEGEKRACTWLGIWVLFALVALSLYLGTSRIFQVDEVQNVYMARILGQGWRGVASTSAPLYLLGPMSWLARAIHGSGELLLADRLVFTGVFWLNIYLTVRACGIQPRSRTGLAVLILAATLAPLWDYGFEVRHDNLVLSGVLGIWILGRRTPAMPTRWRHLAIGLVAAFMQFIAFKSFLYWIPLCALFVLLPADDTWRIRWISLGCLALGLSAGFFLGRMVHAAAGTWPLYTVDFHGGVSASMKTDRFSPWPTLDRLTTQAPLLLGGVATFCWIVVREIRKTGIRAFLRWQGRAPELALFLMALGVLLANPTPFPYNLVLVVPQAFIAVMSLRGDLLAALRRAPKAAILFLPGLGLVHGLTWWTATSRHLSMTNERQLVLIDAAESLTDPAQDGVFDGSGLVNARRPVGFHWLIHTFTIRNFSNGTFPSIRETLSRQPSPVFIPNYRTDWITPEDQQFMKRHYIALSDDFWVLGGYVPPSGGEWTCLHKGRYFLRPESGSGPVSVDGIPQAPGVASLSQGSHEIRGADKGGVWVVWLGPTRMVPPVLAPGSHRHVFVNWY